MPDSAELELRAAVDAAVFDEYLEKLTALAPELTAAELVLVTGYTRVTIIRKIQAGTITGRLVRGRYVIPVRANRALFRDTGIRTFPPVRPPEPEKAAPSRNRGWQGDGRIWLPAATRTLIAALLEHEAAASPSELIAQVMSDYAHARAPLARHHSPPHPPAKSLSIA